MSNPNWDEEALQIAAQCWCDAETSGIEMDARLAKAFARRLSAWMYTGSRHARNEEYWRERAEKAERELARVREAENKMFGLRIAAELRADRAREDAERYRWLRDVGDSTWQPLVERSRLAFPHVPQQELAPMIDEIINGAIDAARNNAAQAAQNADDQELAAAHDNPDHGARKGTSPSPASLASLLDRLIKLATDEWDESPSGEGLLHGTDAVLDFLHMPEVYAMLSATTVADAQEMADRMGELKRQPASASPPASPALVSQGPPDDDAAKRERLPRVVAHYAWTLRRMNAKGDWPIDSGFADILERAAAALSAAPASGPSMTSGPSAVEVPDGWVFHTADFSVIPGRVMLMRDEAGKKIWFGLSEEQQEIEELYVSGKGNTFMEALTMACNRAREILRLHGGKP